MKLLNSCCIIRLCKSILLTLYDYINLIYYTDIGYALNLIYMANDWIE